MSERSDAVTVGFDIGGTNMRAAAVTSDGQIIDSMSVPTPSTPELLESGIIGLVDTLKQKHEVSAVGLAVAGFLDPDCEVVRFAPHLPWRDRHVRAELSDALGLPVRLEHDANSAAWGEYRFGAAQGADNWVLFAVGTGIGATLMHQGEIYRGAFGTAPEFGHLTVVPGGRTCSCGKRGCLERYCSGTALETTAREMIAAGKATESVLIDYLADGSLSGKRIMAAASDGDQLACAVVEDFAQWMGRALSVVADVLDPGLIMIGGGVSTASALYIDTAVETMAASMVGAGYRPLPTVSCAKLGGDAGMIGVSDLARQLV
ncbi:ROK family protein [Corynebacterium pseudotuberculosis]|uniref:ROK family protein n=1 Tax=Corynebacterium pseudotuberculosis TaxID=1719 RepID=UPI00026607EE|nr:ROK family protein [Corynebacterium pseudotuberculosis]AFM07748.1 ROK family protein [Corynebacterium pseudotuberculosis Cp162]APG81978.1 Glucose kinase [Corynebacterium pseudotuberculosis]WFP66566.1 ROK family protein [Corynebacterium pseudotuberculosis]